MDLITLIILAIVNLGAAALAGFLLGKTKIIDENDDRLDKNMKGLASALIFGFLALLGTYSFSAMAVPYNSRDGPVISGGLYFGGIAGIGAAIIAVMYRATLGGVTMIPCIIGTLLAAIISTYVYMNYRERINLYTSMALAFVIEIIHIILVMTLSADGQGVDIIMNTTTGLLVIFSTLWVGIFRYCYNGFKLNA